MPGSSCLPARIVSMPQRTRTPLVLLILVFAAFISIGLPDAALGVAWPEIRSDFHRALPDLGFVLFAGAAGYFTSSALAGTLLERYGVGVILAVSTALVTAGLFCYAINPTFWLMLPIAITIGFGSGAVDAGLNHYAAEHFSVTIMSWLHAFFGVGAMAGPFVMAGTLGAGLQWRIGYVFLAGALLILTVFFFIRINGWGHEDETAHETERSRLTLIQALGRPEVWMQIVLFFCMTGIEATPSVWSATVLQNRFGFDKGPAGVWTGLYWGALTLGRILIPVVSRSIHPARVIQLGTVGLVAGAALTLPEDQTSFQAGILVFGFSMAPLFPMLMSLTPLRLGKDAALHAIGMQVSAAVLAGATIPTLAGIISDRTNLSAISWTMLAGAALVLAINMLITIRMTSVRS